MLTTFLKALRKLWLKKQKYRYNNLFHTHWNDNRILFDDDIIVIVSSVNFWQTLEFTYWLYKSGCNKWHGLDLFPYREDPGEIVKESIKNIKFLYTLAKG